jgi:hypothetical protein
MFTCQRCKIEIFCQPDLLQNFEYPGAGLVCPRCYSDLDSLAKTQDEQTRKAHAQSETLGPMGKIAEGFYLGWNQ